MVSTKTLTSAYMGCARTAKCSPTPLALQSPPSFGQVKQRCFSSFRSARPGPTRLCLAASASSPPTYASLRHFHASLRRDIIRFSKVGSCIADNPNVEEGEEDRALISVSGRDTFKFLQGLVTNDVSHLEKQWETTKRVIDTFDQQGEDEKAADTPPVMAPVPDAFYCAFLNPSGRMIAPVFIYPNIVPPDTTHPHVLIDCHKGNVEGIMSHIKRFKIRSKVKLAPLPTFPDPGEDEPEMAAEDHWEVWTVWDDEGRALKLPEADEGGPPLWRDPRTPSMGYRFLVQGYPPIVAIMHFTSLLHKANSMDGPTGNAEPAAYKLHRLTQGVPEGPGELAENAALPLEANLDLHSGVDFRKGCYIGQELTARTHHTGVVRKRILPVIVRGKGDSPSVPEMSLPEGGLEIRAPPAAEAASRRAKSAGKLVAVEKMKKVGRPTGEPIGLATLRMGLAPNRPGAAPAADGQARPSLTVKYKDDQDVEHELEVEAQWPEWWPEGVVPSDD